MKRLLLATSMLLLLVSRANALIIVVEPDSYADGTNLTHIVEGLTISRLAWTNGSPFGDPRPPTRSDVFPTGCAPEFGGPCATFSRDFGDTKNADLYTACVRGSAVCHSLTFVSVIEFAFDSPVSFFQLWGSWFLDPTVMYAFDSLGNLVDGCVAYGGSPCAEHYSYSGLDDHGSALLHFDHSVRDISRVVVGGAGGGRARVDQIAFNVPEPSTIALLSAGVLGMALRRRLRRQPA